MDNNSVGHAIASVVAEALKFTDAGRLSVDDTKHLIGFCVEVADSFESDVSLVTELMQDRCSVCLKRFAEEELIDWSPETTYPDGDPRTQFAKVAFNNCFGEVMVGGRVCLKCARELPPDGPEF